MAIRLRHDAAAGLIGAYVAGQNRRRRYYRPPFQMRRPVQQQAMQPEIVGFNDPLADDVNLTPAERRQRAAARRARDRKMRLGNDISFNWQATPITQADVQRQQQLDDEQRKFAREDQLRQEGFAREDAQRIADNEFRMQQGILEEGRQFTRNQLEEGPYTEQQRREANDLLRKMGLLRTSSLLRGDDTPAANAQLAALQEQLQQILDDPQGAVEPDRDALGRKYFGEGWSAGLNRLPWDFSGEQPQMPRGLSISTDDFSDELRAQMGLRPSMQINEQLDAQDKAREALIKAQGDLAAAQGGDTELSPGEIQSLQDMVDLRQRQFDRAMSVSNAGVPRNQLPGDMASAVDPFAPDTPIPQPITGAVDPFAPETQIPQPRGAGLDGQVAGSNATAAPMAPQQPRDTFTRQAAAGIGPTVAAQPIVAPRQQAPGVRSVSDTMAAQPMTPDRNLPRVTSDADYDRLAPGTEFIDTATGRKYRKPYRSRPNPAAPTFFDLMVR
jgi:hypothetical protein